ncbi:DUF4145 domain-containing protein [Nocardioides luteus]|uniref:DUF4145 domain-containing protein n=1 Tax=Nocardioides luteus TaxID=1844 RepID=UPI0018C95031|nr:DUF4145 domain-containing protein [Nocardioides luteus]MBG6095960.1 hypothetical protein [Nocardioides luteus]
MDFKNLTGDCPNCHHGSAFKREQLMRAWPTVHFNIDSEGQAQRIPTATAWMNLLILRCLHCKKTVIWRERWAAAPASTLSDDEDPGAFLARMAPRLIGREMVYPNPSPRELHETVPDAIRSLYGEASTCEQAGALRAAGVMYRAAVEELVKERGATGQNLYARIEDLKTKGLDGDLVDDLHEARMLGNDSIHDGLVYSAEEVADVANLIEEATITLYVQPAEKKAMREARKARRDAAKAKN